MTAARPLAEVSTDQRPVLVSPSRSCAGRQLILAGLAGIVVLAAMGLTARRASAQNYKTDPYDDRVRIKLRVPATRAAKNPGEYANAKDSVEQFFRQYYFPVMTQTSPKALEQLGKLRYEFFRQFVWLTTSEAMQQDLTRLAKEEMTPKVTNPAYHPAVRYNAVLLLGMLDQRYGGASQPPEPLADITKLLTQIVKLAGKKRAVTPSLLVGALVGLQRHATYSQSLPPAMVGEIEAAMLGILNAEEPLFEVDSDVHDWIRRQAAGVLTALGSPGDGGRVLDAITALYSDPNMNRTDRAEVAALLGQVDFNGVQGDPIAKSLAQLASEIGQLVAEKAREYRDQRIGTVSGRFRRPPVGRRSRGPQEMTLERRQLVTEMSSIDEGLAAVEPATSEAVRAKVTMMRSAIANLLRDATTDMIDLDLVDSVISTSEAIDQIAANWDSPDEVAADGAAEEGADDEIADSVDF